MDETVRRWGRDVGVDIADEARQVETRVDRLLRSKPVPIRISRGTSSVIPQIGLGGHTDPRTGGGVSITVAAASPLARHDVLTVQLQRTLAHELNHAARITAGPGYGVTLLDTMVSEGLADNFATNLYPTSLAPWTQALSPGQMRRLWHGAQQHLYDVLVRRATYDHWMFGGDGFPNWTGYTLGFDLVASAQRRHPMAWARLTRQTADDILRASHFNP